MVSEPVEFEADFNETANKIFKWSDLVHTCKIDKDR